METLFITVSKSQKTNVFGVLPASNEDCLVQAKVPIKRVVGSHSIISFLRKLHGSLTYKIKPDSSSWH